MENINNNVIEKLNHLIAVAGYSQNNYINTAANVKNEAIKKSLLRNARERTADIAELNSIIRSLGGYDNETNEIVKDTDDTEKSVKSGFTLVDEDSLINECIIKENVVVNAYTEALAGKQIFGSIRDILGYQLSGIRNSMKSIRFYLRKVS
jgi:uncharacterized protein (TIGR02284 family)